jgi:hypothetical protein
MNSKTHRPKLIKSGVRSIFSPKMTLVLCDIAALLLSLLLAYQIRFDVKPSP